MNPLILSIIAAMITAAIGFYAGIHIATIAIRDGARERLTIDEWHEFDRLMNKALDEDAPQ